MKDKFIFVDIEGEENTVTFEIVETDSEYRRYGISTRQINQSGQIVDSAVAKERFITKAEAEAVTEMLCKCQVMPCTLCDVI